MFACGARGEMLTLDHQIDVEKILKLAEQQGVFQTVFLSLKKCYEKGLLPYWNSAYFEAWNNTFLLTMMHQSRRLISIHELYDYLHEHEVEFCVLKGEVVAQNYAYPDCRISSDTDILIKLEDMERVISLLETCGFETEPLFPKSHHLSAHHPISGRLELHFNFVNDIRTRAWFDNKMVKQEPIIHMENSEGIQIPTLSIMDGLHFLTLHFIKHFLSNGVGIRQLMDLLLFMEKNREKIDWFAFDTLLKHLRYKKFMDTCIGFGIHYLNFDSQKLPQVTYNMNHVDLIVDDFEKGGVFGFGESERNNFNWIYTQDRFSRFHEGSFQKYKISHILSRIFIPFKAMQSKFPYLKKKPYLYPVAIVHRWILALKKGSFKKFFGRKSKLLQSESVVGKRMQLIKDLEMI